MKVLLFGDGPALKEKGKALREQNGWTVHLRTAARWAGEVETVDAVYFLAPADAIRAAYRERGIECFLVEEAQEADKAANDDAAPPDGGTDPAETGGDGEASGNTVMAESAANTDMPPPGADGQGAPATPKPEKPAETPPRTPAARPAAYKPKPGATAAKKGK